jgi:phosphoglycerate dehydrogenase-like enzyme
MKPGAYLINTARGGIVDEDALYDSLTREGGLAGAALDVHGREGEGIVPRLAELDNVVLTPHIGAMAVESQQQIGDRIRSFVDAHLQGTLDAEASDQEILV